MTTTTATTASASYPYFRLLQQASFLNSAAVTALMRGEDCDTCLRVFNEALALMERVSMSPSLEKSGSSVPRVSGSVAAPSLDLTETSMMSDDRGFFVCRQALLFDPTYGQSSSASVTGQDCTISEVSLSLYSAIIIFNMALTYHLRSMHTSSASTSHCLQQNALQLYEHCYQILNTILSPPGDDTDMLKLVTLNNQAQIQHSLQRFTEVGALLKDIKQLCPVLLLSHTGACGLPTQQQQQSFYNPQIMKEIGMNALLVTGPPMAAPSA